MTADDAGAIAATLARDALLVVGFCAAWCGTCAEFRENFSALAGRHPEAAFVWIDIEDDADLVGDVDIENFPTLAIYAGDRLLHFGVSLPHMAVVARLIESLDGGSKTVAAEAAVVTLPGRLAQRGPHRTMPSDGR